VVQTSVIKTTVPEYSTPVLRIRIRCFCDPISRIRGLGYVFFPYTGSNSCCSKRPATIFWVTNTYRYILCQLTQIFSCTCAKNYSTVGLERYEKGRTTKFFPFSLFFLWNRVGKKYGSGINIPDPQHCPSHFSLKYYFWIEGKVPPSSPLLGLT
jgi:hypothetical protein